VSPMTDQELAAQLLATPTGCCTSTAYGLFRKYGLALDPIIGPNDAEIIQNLKRLASGVDYEAPERILQRLATRLNCEPRQVFDRVVKMLEERQQNGAQ
jgi:hypothetical protein